MKEFLSVESVAEMFDTTRTTINRLVEKGILPKPVEIGGLKRWSRDALMKAVGFQMEAAANPQILDDPDDILRRMKNGNPDRTSRARRRDH